MLPDYGYYVSTYHGDQITGHDFPRLITRAGAYLKKVVPNCAEDDNYMMAACAVAEAWQTNEAGGEVASESVGSWSRTFAKSGKTKASTLFDAAALYLPDYLKAVRWI